MATPRPLARPPVREAIIEVRTEPVALERVTALREAIAGGYPNATPFRLASTALRLPEERRGAGVDAASNQTGWRCESADGAEVALIRTDGLSFGRLSAYPGWDPFVDRCLSVWGRFVDVVRPVEVRSVSARYVNDLRLPVGAPFEFERFLTAVPRPPAGLSPALTDFLVQMTLPGGAEGLQVEVTLATDASVRHDTTLPVILDIDASWERTLVVDERAPARLQEALATLRDLKNRVFFGMLTDQLLDAYR